MLGFNFFTSAFAAKIAGLATRSAASFALLSALLLTSCNYSHVKGQTDEGLGDLTACGPIDYATVHQKIFFVRCVGCHKAENAEKGVLLDNFASVKANLDRVQAQVQENKMPQGKPLNNEEKKFLLAWIAQGAPETTEEPSVQSCSQDPVSEPTPLMPGERLEASYNSLNKNIFSFEKKCTSCHDAKAPFGKAKYDFSTFASTITYTKLFNLQDPRQSRFVQALITGDMPAVGEPVASADIEVIIEWISQGLPEEIGGAPGIKETEPSVPPVPSPIPTVPVTPVDPNAPLCDDLIDFKTVNAKIFEPVCLRCHGFATLPSFDSYANVRQNLVKLEGMVRLNKMPPKRPLDDDLKNLLFKWIKNGSPETVDKTGCAPGTVTPALALPTATNLTKKQEFL